jgi:hypothetical protein
MSGSSTDGAGASPPTVRQRELIRRFRACPMGPHDPEMQAMLLPLRNVAAAGKDALMRLPAERGWTLVRLGGRGRPVEVLGGRWTSRADAEWAVFRARWQSLHGWDPEAAHD